MKVTIYVLAGSEYQPEEMVYIEAVVVIEEAVDVELNQGGELDKEAQVVLFRVDIAISVMQLVYLSVVISHNMPWCKALSNHGKRSIVSSVRMAFVDEVHDVTVTDTEHEEVDETSNPYQDI